MATMSRYAVRCDVAIGSYDCLTTRYDGIAPYGRIEEHETLWAVYPARGGESIISQFPSRGAAEAWCEAMEYDVVACWD